MQSSSFQSKPHLLNNRYKKVKVVGHGSYGTVYLALDTKPSGISRKIDQKYLNMLNKIDETKNYSSAE